MQQTRNLEGLCQVAVTVTLLLTFGASSWGHTSLDHAPVGSPAADQAARARGCRTQPAACRDTTPHHETFVEGYRRHHREGSGRVALWLNATGAKADRVEDFRQATIENARNSLQEPGVARFDVAQNTAEPARFVLIEVYRDAAAATAHKETAHYAKWRDAVAEMMAEPRSSMKYSNVFPFEEGW